MMVAVEFSGYSLWGVYLYTTGILEKIKNRKSKQMKIVAIFGSGIIAICIIVSLILTIVEFLS